MGTMKDVYIIEDDEALVKILSTRVKDKSDVTFITMKDLIRLRHEVLLKKQKIVVDISRNRDYISFCNDLMSMLGNSLEQLLFLVNSEQFSELKSDGRFSGSILNPRTAKDIISFINQK